MVVIHLKINEKNQFLYEVPYTTKIEEVIKDLVIINNLRCKIDIISVQIEDLLKHGPLKREEERGLNETIDLDKDIEDKYKPRKVPMPERVGFVYVEDPSHHRTGWTFEKEVVERLMKDVYEIKKRISIESVQSKSSMKISELTEMIDLLRAIVYINYPAYHGLPDWEPCRVNLEVKEDILHKEDIGKGEFYNYLKTTLWCAGREYERGKVLSDYTGKNDKTKVICKFSVKGSGAPVREPVVDSETQKKMMQMYFKKQEEVKRLEVNNEDEYLSSSWADSQNLKKSLYTGSSINWKFK